MNHMFSDQKVKAIEHLTALWERKRQLELPNDNRNIDKHPTEGNWTDMENNDGVSKIELLLRLKEQEMELLDDVRDDDIGLKLREYSLTKRSALDRSAIDYWAERKHTNKELYELSTITNSVPITQVSVERPFSALAFILSPLRNSLSAESLENILLIRLNKEVFLNIPTIHEI